jgi:hypothetical protein
MKGFDIMFSYEIKKELACEMIDYIENYGIQDMYLCDIANTLYNNDYYIIGIYKAKEWLKKYFDDMLETIEYWEDETGEPYGQMITDIENLATLVAYTVVDNLLYEAYDYIGLDSNDICDEEMEQKIYQYLLNEYK